MPSRLNSQTFGAAEEGRLDGNPVADFPAEALGGFCPGDGARAIFHEVSPLIVGNDEFRENRALIFESIANCGKKFFSSW